MKVIKLKQYNRDEYRFIKTSAINVFYKQDGQTVIAVNNIGTYAYDIHIDRLIELLNLDIIEED